MRVKLFHIFTSIIVDRHGINFLPYLFSQCIFNKRLLFFFWIFGYQFSAGQNLVPNSSFEDTIACPSSANEIDYAFGWNASRGSPDYYNECNHLSASVSVPSNFNGYQYAHSGFAYAGFVAYTVVSSNIREYFSCRLLDTLQIGSLYSISFYLSLSGSAGDRIACNKIGCLFSTVDYNLSNQAPITNGCQFFTDSIVTDSMNWIYINGNFIADSNYVYLTIGNFFDDSNTDTLMLAPITTYSYYYIDDIYLSEVETNQASNYSLGKELSIYPNSASNNILILSKGNKIIGVEVLNIDGQLIAKSNEQSARLEINLPLGRLSQGLYYLKIQFTDSRIEYYNFIKL